MQGYSPRPRGYRWLAALALATAAVMTLAAQPQDPRFEVASVKPSARPQPPFLPMGLRGRLYHVVTTPRSLIRMAYDLQSFQRVDGSQPILDDVFSVDAVVADDAVPTPELVDAMLRSLLAERFALRVRFEDEMQEAGVLRRVRADALGRGLSPIEEACASIGTATAAAAAPAAPAERRCGLSMIEGTLTGSVRSMSQFAEFVSLIGGLPVFDETDLRGSFEIRTTFNPESLDGTRRVAPSSPATQFQAFTAALRDDLGLRMDSERRPVSMVVVDHIQEPSAN